jgi:integrase
MGVRPPGRQPLPYVDLSEEVRATFNPRYFTPPGKSKEYEHGTSLGYDVGGDRCEYCRAAKRQVRRADRETFAAIGKTRANPKSRGLIIHRDPESDVIPYGWWTDNFRPYLIAAGIDWPTFVAYHTRHTHASWLAERGVSPYVIQKRMGHSDIKTTFGYISIDGGDEEATQAISSWGIGGAGDSSTQELADVTSLSNTELMAEFNRRFGGK